MIWPLEGAEDGDRVHHGLPDRALALARQPVRLPAAVRVLRGAAGAARAAAVLGHRRSRSSCAALAILGGVALIEQFHSVIYVLGRAAARARLPDLQGRQRERRPRQEPRWCAPCAASSRSRATSAAGTGSSRRTARATSRRCSSASSAIVFADIAFAIDSIPAAFGITRDAFIIWMGNVFALLGLRALFVLVEGLTRALPLPRRDDRGRARRSSA